MAVQLQKTSEDLFYPLELAYATADIPNYAERKNSGTGKTMWLGIGNRRNYGVGESRNNDKFQNLLTEARILITRLCPELNWTAIQVNINYEAEWHCDKNNDGKSLVVAFGDYEGGELETEDGKVYDLRHRPVVFEAAKVRHRVRPITRGTRYSIVFFRPRFPKAFQNLYGSLTYGQLEALLPLRGERQPASEIRMEYEMGHKTKKLE
jgi:hypothetical protein